MSSLRAIMFLFDATGERSVRGAHGTWMVQARIEQSGSLRTPVGDLLAEDTVYDNSETFGCLFSDIGGIG